MYVALPPALACLPLRFGAGSDRLKERPFAGGPALLNRQRIAGLGSRLGDSLSGLVPATNV